MSEDAGLPADKQPARLHLAALGGAGAALLLAVLLLFSPASGGLVMPGPLTSHHAALAKNCSACHAEKEGLLKGFFHGSRDFSDPEIGRVESQRCLACHALGANALLAHGQAEEDMEALERESRAQESTGGAPLELRLARALGGRPPHLFDGALSCATCHREHQGSDFNLARLGDSQCQICHRGPFGSFSSGHSELGAYPYERRTRIVFDHATHERKHFAEKQEKFECESCHVPDPRGVFQTTATFEKSCAGCHTAELLGEGRASAGIAFLRIPALDLEVLQKLGESVAPWPADAARGYDGLPTAFMQLLLAGDEKYPEFQADRALLAPMDLMDLVTTTDEELSAVVRYAWGIKRLFYDLATRGQAGLKARLEKALGEAGPQLEDPQWLAGELSEAAVRDAQERWLRGVIFEIPRHDATSIPSAAELGAGKAQWLASGAWARQDSDFSLHYLVSGHADEFLTLWLNFSGSLAGKSEEARAVFEFLGKEDGRCTKCHSVDAGAEGGFLVNWKAAPAPKGERFTFFAHKPHLKVMSQEEGCRDCHTQSPEADYLGSFKDNADPAVFTSDLAPMSKAACAECHAPAGSGQQCTLCHNYHVGEIPPARPVVEAAE